MPRVTAAMKGKYHQKFLSYWENCWLQIVVHQLRITEHRSSYTLYLQMSALCLQKSCIDIWQELSCKHEQNRNLLTRTFRKQVLPGNGYSLHHERSIGGLLILLNVGYLQCWLSASCHVFGSLCSDRCADEPGGYTRLVSLKYRIVIRLSPEISSCWTSE